MPKEADAKAPAKRTLKSATPRARSRVAAVRKTIRKAPPRTAAIAGSSSSLKTAIALSVALIVIGGASVAIGMSDTGQINVSSTISQRASEQQASGDVEGSAATRAVNAGQPSNPSTPNGGLVGRGNRETEQQRRAPQQAPANAASSATSTATSSAELATSSAASSADTQQEATETEDTSAETADGASSADTTE